MQQQKQQQQEQQARAHTQARSVSEKFEQNKMTRAEDNK
jgi:hypothetical protein